MLILKNGNCLDLLGELEDASIDLICADMPYGTTNCKWDSIIDLVPLWVELERVIKDNGAIVLFAQTPFDKVLGASNLKLLRYEWIWEKPSATGFFNAHKMPMKAHENILVFYKKLPTYNPKKTTGHLLKVSSRFGCKSEIYGKEVKKTEYSSTERFPRSVIKFSSDKQREKYHPTQKPLELLRYLIETYSNKSDTVLDFCMGSGTAGVAAIQEGRKFIGFELDEEFFNVAKSRINNSTSQLEIELKIENMVEEL